MLKVRKCLLTVVAVALLAGTFAACTPGASDAPGRAGNCYGHEPANTAIRNAFWDTPDLDYMMHVAHGESGCDPGARNSSGASGIFQIMIPLHNDLFAALADQGCWPYGFPLWQDAGCNAKAARLLYNSSGRGPWALAAHTGSIPTYTLVTLRMSPSKYDNLTGGGWARQEAYDVWLFVAGANYAQALMDAEAAQARDAALNRAHWTAIHNCEEPGNWYAAGSTSDGYFEGGLGISRQAWAENSQGEPASALQATPEQQMEVANRIRARFGDGAWACKAA